MNIKELHDHPNFYYGTENGVLLKGDCLEIMPTLELYFDLTLSDPPYGTTQCKWDSVVDLGIMWSGLKRLMKPNGAIILTAQRIEQETKQLKLF